MVVDKKVVINTVNETREFKVKAIEEVPPIPLLEVGLVLLAIIGGGAAYYVSREVRKR